MIGLLALVVLVGLAGFWFAGPLAAMTASAVSGTSVAPSDRRAALALIGRLMRLHGITPEEAAVAAAAAADGADVMPVAAVAARSGRDVAKTLFGYLGAIFICAGLGSYIGSFWAGMGSAMRILITLGTGYLLLVLLVVALHEKKYPRLETPLVLASVAMLTGGWFVLIHEFFPGGNDWRRAAVVVFGVMAVHQGALLWRHRLTVLALTALGFAYGFMQVGLDLIGVPDEFAAIALGASLFIVAHELSRSQFERLAEGSFLVAVAWLNAGVFDLVAQHQDARLAAIVTGLSVACAGYGLQRAQSFPRLVELGYAAGSVLLYAGLFDLVRGSVAELAFLAATAAALYACVQLQSRALLLTTVLAMLGFIGYFGAEHFAHSLGWPITLVLMGVAFLGVSVLAMRVRREVSGSRPPQSL